MGNTNGTKWKDRLPECPQKRRACLSYHGGKCAALTDTEFKRSCPFYKTKAMVYAKLGDELGEAALA